MGSLLPPFQLEHGAQVVLEVHALRAQEVEHRRGVGRRHGGGKQEGGGQRKGDVGAVPPGDVADEKPGEEGGDEHADGGEQNALGEHGAYLGELGIHSSGEEDDAERHHADELCVCGAVELEPEPVAPEEHADEQEEEQRGYAEAIARLADEYAAEDKHGAEQQDVFCGEYHRREWFVGVKIGKNGECEEGGSAKNRQAPASRVERQGLEVRLRRKQCGITYASSELSGWRGNARCRDP